MRDDISPIVGAFSRRPLSEEPYMYWLPLPPTMDVHLSPTERQRGVVLGVVRHALLTRRGSGAGITSRKF